MKTVEKKLETVEITDFVTFDGKREFMLDFGVCEFTHNNHRFIPELN